MCPSRLWCRALVGALLVALGASMDLYDQPHPLEDLFYQDGNDIDTEELRFPPRVSNVMLSKIIKALHLAPDDPFRPSNLPPETAQRHPKRAEEVETKGAVFKRLSEVWGSHHLPYKTDLRPQQKWKIKKGKAIGSQMVCYFKLCAFRSPA